MRTSVRYLAAATVAALGTGLAATWGPASAQQPIRVGTSLVRVDVYPTLNGAIVDGLTADDFEVFENDVVQRVESFEHIVPTRGPQTARMDPNNTRDMLAAIRDGRNRLFLIFLDTTHVDQTNAVQMNEPLTRFLRQELADEDLVAVMTPEMSVANLTFMRRTEAIERQLKDNFDWGRHRRQLPELDARSIQYELCYPPIKYADLALKMTERRRERMTLEALQDVVRWLPTIREERKAIVTVTQGWRLYQPDPTMLEIKETALLNKPRVGPTGQLTTENPNNTVNVSKTECDADRTKLAAIDNDRLLKDLIDDANLGNASFYMIDPGGLQVARPDRSNAMRTLADNTDGLALLNSNDFNKAWRRIADDQSSYYLLGYYTTNPKPDGRYRSITVKVKRPGVSVRARRGYRAPTVEEVTLARRDVPAAAAPEAPGAATGGSSRRDARRDQARLEIRGQRRGEARPGRRDLGRGRAVAGPGAARRVHARRVGHGRSDRRRCVGEGERDAQAGRTDVPGEARRGGARCGHDRRSRAPDVDRRRGATAHRHPAPGPRRSGRAAAPVPPRAEHRQPAACRQEMPASAGPSGSASRRQSATARSPAKAASSIASASAFRCR